jgi:hypothetical protein
MCFQIDFVHNPSLVNGLGIVRKVQTPAKNSQTSLRATVLRAIPRQSGFEWYYRRLAENYGSDPPDGLVGREEVINSVTHSDLRELACALAACSVLAQLADGESLDEESGSLADPAIAMAQAASAERAIERQCCLYVRSFPFRRRSRNCRNPVSQPRTPWIKSSTALLSAPLPLTLGRVGSWATLFASLLCNPSPVLGWLASPLARAACRAIAPFRSNHGLLDIVQARVGAITI